MNRRPPRSQRTYTHFPNPTLFRSRAEPCSASARLYAARSASVVKDSPQPHSAATFGLLNTNCSFSPALRSEEHTSELQPLMRISYPVFCLKKKTRDQ